MATESDGGVLGRLDKLDSRVDGIDSRVAAIEKVLAEIPALVEKEGIVVTQRIMEALDRRLDAHEGRIELIVSGWVTKSVDRLETTQEKFAKDAAAIVEAMNARPLDVRERQAYNTSKGVK